MEHVADDVLESPIAGQNRLYDVLRACAANTPRRVRLRTQLAELS
jgi:hypothetical protein